MIKFDKVAKKFPDGTVAFSDLSFTVDEGDLALITGPSGSGKTTVMNLLIREYLPTQGDIFFEDTNTKILKGRRVCQHRRRVGVVFQDYKLISELNVWENIALPLYVKGERQSEVEERITDLLKLVGLSEKGLMFPKQLSGGEAQRVSIARALATGPKLIFADEPTGNLDKKTSERVIHLLQKINQLGTTLIIATHDPLVIDKLQVKTIDLGSHNITAASKSIHQTKPDQVKDDKIKKTKKDISEKISQQKEKEEKEKVKTKEDQDIKKESQDGQSEKASTTDQAKEKEQKDQVQTSKSKQENKIKISANKEKDSKPETKSTGKAEPANEKPSNEFKKITTKTIGFFRKIKGSLNDLKKKAQSEKDISEQKKKTGKTKADTLPDANSDSQPKSTESTQSDSK